MAKKLTIQKPKIEEPTAEPKKPVPVPAASPAPQEPAIHVTPVQRTTAELEIEQSKERTDAPHTAVFKDGIIPSTPGHRIIIANANQLRYEQEPQQPEAKHRAVISPDDNKILRGN